MLSRQRPSTAEVEQVLDGLLSSADQAMVNAFTGGFRVTQTKLAITRVVSEEVAAVALESAQIVALAVLVREQLHDAQFAALYRPFATVLPGPGYQPPAPVDRQIAAFLARLPTLSGPTEAEAAAVAKVLSEPPRPATLSVAGAPAATPSTSPALDPAAHYQAAWKAVIEAANKSGRTMAFRAAQDGAEMAAPHDGSGIVGHAGVAAGGIFMRDLLPVEQVLLLYEPFAAAFPYESLQ
ncbi:MAG TPA: hypothetical protein VLR46_06830 [Candidatus Dormibacteraeota bacterium]|nr:hypothetical protein [Candidatus Dormibacteraeota bacterium]